MQGAAWPADDQFRDFLLGGWWLENFVKVEMPNVDHDPDAWIENAMIVRFWDTPIDGALW